MPLPPPAARGHAVLRRRLSAVLVLISLSASLFACGTTDTVRSDDDTCATGRSLAVGTKQHVLERDGQKRVYLVHVPPAYDGSTRTPVVFLFHGLGGSAAAMLQTTRMADLADRSGFIVVAPQARGAVSTWDFRTRESTVRSDLGFVKSLVTTIKGQACVDSSRVYAAGFSNGSALTLALACDGSTPFAAYGAVSAPYYVSRCESSPPASIIYFHGMADRVVPFGGAQTAIGPLPGVNRALSEWQVHDDCPSTGSTTTVTARVRHFAWESCRDGSAVEMYAVANGGHRWPGGTESTPGHGDGVTTQDIDASTLIWNFFERHPRGGQ
ncbi:PHB depolymerase family esterase [Aeromicrobium sp.]|uniref:extracellular catalytic domain type 1 short-chain-length polyhydroxyalkanoate depolymerase n=1 Tax=Aeromicrobium sp. TaxID=1871063 RepID=UPI00199602C1|nr:PHB depolymerase family esterase [Aeromicrobium sp.]MBC7631707.1 hypothetical protein [Aeromicrobium sp.]